MRNYIIVIACAFSFGCSHQEIPKPRGYFRIELPKKEYQLYQSDAPFQFEYPVYGKAVKDTDRISEPYWMNIEFGKFNCKIHLSYKAINKNVAGFIEDAHTLAYKHSIKADAINEELFTDSKRKVYGLLYDIDGNAASSVQFFVTDSVNHFMRGALYFENIPNKDSLAPAIAFFRKDIVHIIETINWK